MEMRKFKKSNLVRLFSLLGLSFVLGGCSALPTLVSENALVHDDLSALKNRYSLNLPSSMTGEINFSNSSSINYAYKSISYSNFDSSYYYSVDISASDGANDPKDTRWWFNFSGNSIVFSLRYANYNNSNYAYVDIVSNWTWSFYDADNNLLSLNSAGNYWYGSGELSKAVFSTTAQNWALIYASVVEGYEEGYSSGSSEGYSNGYNSGYSSGYDDGESDGYNDGYSSGYYTGSSEGYSSGYESGHAYASTSWVVGRSAYALSVPQYSTYTGYQAWAHMYTGAPLGYTSKKVEFNNGSYVEFFKEAYALNEAHTALGYRFVAANGTITPLYYVVYDGSSTYTKFVYGYDSDSGFVSGYFPLVNSSDGVVSLKIVALDDGGATELNESYLIPYYDDGYSVGYADGQTAPTNLPDNYAEGYAQGLADGNDGWNTIIPTVFASVGAFFYPWTTIEIFGISILGIFGIVTVIGVLCLVIKVFLK